ncbi:hypothetical protein DXG01_000878 [Tephrocybe rancida]|nr:hypothetical protein DXG01_000878 [Tephrocybe rancida]
MELYPTSPVILAGGLATLEALSQNAKTSLWSTQPILDDPKTVIEAHSAFLRAGARIIMTSTYQACVDTFKRAGYSEVDARDTMRKGVYLASEARESFIQESTGKAAIVKIALSLGPFGATLSPPQEFDGYYPSPYGPMEFSETELMHNSFDEEDIEGEENSVNALAQFHLERLLVYAQDPETWKKIDIIAFETVPLVREALAIRKAMLALGDKLSAELNSTHVGEKAWWLSFVFPSGKCPQKSSEGQPRTVYDIVHHTLLPITTPDDRLLPIPTGIGINCTAPQFIPGLLREFTQAVGDLSSMTTARPWFVLYPNGGDVYDIMTRSWLTSPGNQDSWAIDLKDSSNAVEQEYQNLWGGLVIGAENARLSTTKPTSIELFNSELMDDSNDNMDDVEETQETQQQTQSTQQSSQQAGDDMNGHLWGYLQPCGGGLTRIDFWRMTPRYKLGRSKELNDCVLPGPKINGSKIGRGQTRVLREGNEIAFGTCVPQQGSLEDYRFIYRHTASGPPTTGLYAFYDMFGELGKGSFAVVMKAFCRKSGEYVAVKMIQDARSVRSPGDQAGRPRREYFNREIDILEKLKHDNICELKEVFFQEESNEINLVLELVEGGDLLDYILKKGGLSEPDTQHITYQLCDALAYIHSQNVTHRDLKPENVLLTKDNPPKVKVADFGLAKFVDSLTMLRTMCGTPSYLAPEVVTQQNNEGYDSLVDSWSVGVIVFSMLTNSSPFIEGDGNQDVRTRVIERTIDWSLLRNMNASPEAIDFIRRLMEQDPRNRMTLANSLEHPWLKSHVPVYGRAASYSNAVANNIPVDDFSMISSIPDNEGSFRGSVNADFQNLHLEAPAVSSTPAVPGAFPNNSLVAQPSRGVPLQRGSLITLQAAENGTLPEPPVEMIANAAAQELREQQQATGPNELKGFNKRVHSELTPLSEEASMGAVMDEAGPSVNNTPNDAKSDSTPAPGKKTRGKGKAASTSPTKASARLAAKGAENEETSAATPRRTTRPQKVARR